jgi:hypothetical protein
VSSQGPAAGLIRRAARVRARLTFRGSAPYWEKRYATGGTSGAGSYGPAARWKSEVVNRWVADNGVTPVVDLGWCIEQYAGDATKSFAAFDPAAWHDPAGWFRADLGLSMEVIFHLVEDEVLDSYLQQLFGAAERFVVICAYDGLMPARAYEHHRPFTPWVVQHAPDWELVEHERHPPEIDLLSDLYLYRRRT